jgi:hypothetical protein
MILPTLWVEVFDRKSADRYGQAKVARPVRVRVAPVKLIFSDDRTTVRTDSSASHGAARETVANVVVLANPRSPINKGDQLQILGRRVLVTAVHTRFTVLGVHDHDEFHCETV